MKKIKEIKDTTFVLVRLPKSPVEPELEKRINESVRGLERNDAVEKALEIVAAAGQKPLCGIPSERDPDICYIFLPNKV